MNSHGIPVHEAFLHIGAALVLIMVTWFAIQYEGFRRFLLWTAGVASVALVVLVIVLVNRAPAQGQSTDVEVALRHGCLNKQTQEPANQSLRPLAIYQYCDCVAKYTAFWMTPNDVSFLNQGLKPPAFDRLAQEAGHACMKR